MNKTVAFDDDRWELYDTTTDWTQAHDLAAEQPEKLHELQRLFLIEATKYNVLPLDDRGAERFNPDMAGRPTLIGGTRQLLFAGMGNLNENCVLNIKNKSHGVTAEVVIPDGGANSTWTSTTMTTSSAPKNASASPWPDSRRRSAAHQPVRLPSGQIPPPWPRWENEAPTAGPRVGLSQAADDAPPPGRP